MKPHVSSAARPLVLALAGLVGFASVCAAQKAPPAEAPSQAPAAAPDAAALAAAKEFLEVSGASRQIETVVPVMLAQMLDVFVKMKPTARKEIEEAFAAAGKTMLARKGELIAEIAPVYARKMTAGELREMIAFFKSPTGVRFVSLQPAFLQESMAIGARWGQRIGQELEAEVRRDLKKRGIDL